jgi:hypothetical protein
LLRKMVAMWFGLPETAPARLTFFGRLQATTPLP